MLSLVFRLKIRKTPGKHKIYKSYGWIVFSFPGILPSENSVNSWLLYHDDLPIDKDGGCQLDFLLVDRTSCWHFWTHPYATALDKWPGNLSKNIPVSMILINDRTQNSTGKSGTAIQEDVMVVAFARWWFGVLLILLTARIGDFPFLHRPKQGHTQWHWTTNPFAGFPEARVGPLVDVGLIVMWLDPTKNTSCRYVFLGATYRDRPK